jgi:hypothetical protein
VQPLAWERRGCDLFVDSLYGELVMAKKKGSNRKSPSEKAADRKLKREKKQADKAADKILKGRIVRRNKT